MRRRFVHRRSSRGRGSIAVAAITLLAMLPSIGLMLPAFKPFMLGLNRVDPALIEIVNSYGSAVAYVASTGGIPPIISCIDKWQFGDLYICKTVVTKEVIDRLLEDPRVVSIYGYKVYKAPFSTVLFEDYLETAKRVDIDNVFHNATGPWCGRNVTVAVIDTGIDYTHPDFYDEHNKTIIKVLVSVVYESNGHPLVWIPYVNGSMQQLLQFDQSLQAEYGEPAFLDVNGHGTHVAGIIAGRGWASNGKYRGIAPCAKLVIIKAFDRSGSASLDACLSALEWVYNHAEEYNISILNLSWGAAYASDGNDPLSLAVDKIVVDKGVWVFAAAGNEGNFPTTIVVPAVAKHAIAVGAWDPYADKLAPFSSLGPTIDMRMKPDFVAAGVMVVAPASRYVSWPDYLVVEPGYVALSGTSMATPAVAGIAAVFIEYWEYWHGTKPSLEDFIRWEVLNGRRVNPLAKDFVSGYGIPVAPHT